MQNILDKSLISFTENKPFVLYSKPNSQKLQAYFQNNDDLEVFESQSGFIFADFSSKNKYVISIENSIYLEDDIANNIIFNNEESIETSFPKDQEHFEAIVETAIQEIKKESFKKVVLSRKVTLDFKTDWLMTFLNTIILYKEAFNYVFFHPKVGMWLGATPEKLVSIQDSVLTTVSLAGTQLHSEKVHWQTKEMQEQQIVTDYILEKTESISNKSIISDPYTIKAGKLAHLKTDITLHLKPNVLANDIISILHPTPAVCGMPKNKAYDFILANENYDRSFYTGFLGEWNVKNQSNLFVNLRCMKLETNSVSIFVGCGITKESNAQKEFVETENKSQTMLQILKRIS